MTLKYKVVLLGNSMVGKTSIADRLTRGIFYDYTGSTIGAAYSYLKKGDINMDLWDTAGQERYMSIMPMYFRNADIVLLVFDLSDLQSVDRLYYYLDRIDKEVRHNHTIIIIGNKLDLVDAKLLDKIEKDIARNVKKYTGSKTDTHTVFVSAKNDTNMNKLSDIITESCKKINKTEDEKNKNIKLEETQTYYQYWASYCNC